MGFLNSIKDIFFEPPTNYPRDSLGEAIELSKQIYPWHQRCNPMKPQESKFPYSISISFNLEMLEYNWCKQMLGPIDGVWAYHVSAINERTFYFVNKKDFCNFVNTWV